MRGTAGCAVFPAAPARLLNLRSKPCCSASLYGFRKNPTYFERICVLYFVERCGLAHATVLVGLRQICGLISLLGTLYFGVLGFPYLRAAFGLSPVCR